MKTHAAEVRHMHALVNLLRRLGLAWKVSLPENLPPRPERIPLPHPRPARRLSAHFDLL